MTEREMVDAIADELHLPADEVAPIVHAALVRVYGDEDAERGHIPLANLPLTKGEHDGYPLGTRGEAGGAS